MFTALVDFPGYYLPPYEQYVPVGELVEPVRRAAYRCPVNLAEGGAGGRARLPDVKSMP